MYPESNRVLSKRTNKTVKFELKKNHSGPRIKNAQEGLPGDPVAQAPHSQCRGPQFDPWLGNYIPHATTKTQDSQINNQLKYMYKKIMHRKGTRKLDAGETGNCPSYPGHKMRAKLILFW